MQDNCQQEYYLVLLVHTTPARQKMLKLSHYCPNTNNRIIYANPSGKSMPIGDGTQTDRQKTPNLGSIFPPSYGWCSCSTTGLLSPISTRIYSKSLHCTTKNSYLCKNLYATFRQKLIHTRFAIGFKTACLAYVR